MLSTEELEEQKQLVLNRDQTIAYLKAEVSVLKRMHLSIESRTIGTEASRASRASKSKPCCNLGPLSGSVGGGMPGDGPATPKESEVTSRFFWEEVRKISREPPARPRVYYYINGSIKIKI
jgi:hypothetical protein